MKYNRPIISFDHYKICTKNTTNDPTTEIKCLEITINFPKTTKNEKVNLRTKFTIF